MQRVFLRLERFVAGLKTKKGRPGNVEKIVADNATDDEAITEPIYADWDAVLGTHARPGQTAEGVTFTGLDYEGLAVDDRFERIVEGLAALAPEAVHGMGPNARCALYINAYNILCCARVVRAVKSGQRPGSILELSKKPAIWDVIAGNVAGDDLTLNKIEHEILRGGFDEPRLHACVNCASRSCPNLRVQAYRGTHLDSQMNEQMALWLQDKSKGLNCDFKQRPKISRIFLWFESDFKPQGVSAFVAGFVKEADRDKVKRASNKFNYFDYNWNLNEAPAAAA
ncbi:hypothetical protein CTAYLR_002275 [Chrysophaeum taylorii]|uniref:DUF547 domain-containing protein n=1 Tax=Chrysophaeum taylorii TaxID=2483200 RepID=A0AAD7XRI9_9STRA|nr:hypothetical protein CTAYLR_002275 [Chrysophaeum taylorii]